MKFKAIISQLKKQANPSNVAGMARYGINPENTLGINTPFLRGLAKEIGKDHDLALQLWESGIHEARILAAYIDDPQLVTSKQMDSWVKDFDSWDICDQACNSLFCKTPFAYPKVAQWTESKKEFIRRAGFVMIAALATHDKKAPDEKFLQFFPFIERYSTDERNFVKKALNWALRQIGKKKPGLKKTAIALAEKLAKSDASSARWAGKDALRELSAKL
jgi:3-methyladenine DNA glycosylase AlkD